MARDAAILPFRLWQLAIPAVAALVGLIAGISPPLGIGLALGVVYVVIVLQNLALGLGLFVAVTFLESIGGLGALSVAKLSGGLLALSWLALIATNRGRARQLTHDHPLVAAALITLAAWAGLSMLWAEFPAASLDGAQRWALNLALFPIVYTAVRRPSDVRWFFWLFVAGALISAAIGVATGHADVTETGRLEGSGVNANELGELLIVAVVFATALSACREVAVPLRALAFACAGLAVLALVTTLSRAALLGLVTALVVTPLLIGRGRRAMAMLLVVAASAGTAGYILVVAPSSTLERITASDATGSGRTEIWQIGWRMVQDKPLHGVGASNYPTSTVHYLFEPGTITRSAFIVDDPKAAHNIYLQVQAELGLVGFSLFLGIIVFSLISLLRAARRFALVGDRSMELLSRALLIALFGLLAAAFFSTAVYSKQMWLLLALGAAMSAMANERTA